MPCTRAATIAPPRTRASRRSRFAIPTRPSGWSRRSGPVCRGREASTSLWAGSQTASSDGLRGLARPRFVGDRRALGLALHLHMQAPVRILLVYPEFPTTYWGFQHSLELVGRRATLPPLGLISVAALLPQDWEFRLVDMNVERLRRDDIRWADVVLSSGMLVQEPSMHAI